MLLQGIQYAKNPYKFFVRFNKPNRAVYDMRTEYAIDAYNINKALGPVNLFFSTGIDSQITLRSFLDNNIVPNIYFVKFRNHYTEEYDRIKECEDFYKVKVNIIDCDLNNFRQEYLQRISEKPYDCIFQFVFGWLSEIIPNNLPLAISGPHDLGSAVWGSTTKNFNLYWNYFQGTLQRFRLMSKYRKVIDFPFSPESMSATYTDKTLKTFGYSVKYYRDLFPQLDILDHYTYLIKPALFASNYKDSIIWHGKISGWENKPDWLENKFSKYIKNTGITVPYWDLVDFYENSTDQYRDYSTFNYYDHPSFNDFQTVGFNIPESNFTDSLFEEFL